MISVRHKQISALADTTPAIFYCLFRTAVNTCHTVNAAAFPARKTLVVNADIYNRTNLFAKTAFVAFLCGAECLVLYKHPVKQGVDLAEKSNAFA